MNHDSSLLIRAANYAAMQHAQQRRKDAAASPYINHPIAVAAMLAEAGGAGDLELLAAALLHDTVEDTSSTLDEIMELFGREVRDLVADVTDDKSLPKAVRKRHQVEHATRKSDRAKQLKIADKICNVRDIDETSPVGWDRERKVEYLQWAENVVAGCRGVNERLDQLFDEVLHAATERLASG